MWCPSPQRGVCVHQIFVVKYAGPLLDLVLSTARCSHVLAVQREPEGGQATPLRQRRDRDPCHSRSRGRYRRGHYFEG